MIPAYNPDQKLLNVVDDLRQLGVQDIIIVNDGSAPECDPIFRKLSDTVGCAVLSHAVNMGKGRALKTGLNHFYVNYSDRPGVVTADADGQHRAEDILRVGKVLEEKGEQFVLGARKFRKEIPFRSLFGNVLTKYLFRALIGRKVSDTQSGLRGLRRDIVPNLLKLRGENYEYELNVLISTKVHGLDITEVPIESVYIDGNQSSHFNPLIDSMRIYFILLRFLFSSLFASVVDVLFFALFLKFSNHVLLSHGIARAFSSVVNYGFNKRVVFHDKQKPLNTIVQYYALVLVIATLSYLIIRSLVGSFSLNPVAAKIVADTFLFVMSFLVQRDLIFVRRPIPAKA